MIWYQSPTLQETIKLTNAFFPGRKMPLALGSGVPSAILELDGGVWSLHSLALSDEGKGPVKGWPFLKKDEPLFLGNSKPSLVQSLEFFWPRRIEPQNSEGYLIQVGYDPVEKWIEFSAVVPSQENLKLSDLRTIQTYRKNGTPEGPVNTVRVTFVNWNMARKQAPWLMQMGVEVQYLADGSWPKFTQADLQKPLQEDDFEYSDEFKSMLRNVVDRNWEEVEGDRDRFGKVHLEEANRAYFELETWSQKAVMVQLVQNLISPITKPMMLDFLKAPPLWDDDSIWMSKVVALCHVTESMAKFCDYLDMGNEEVEEVVKGFLASN